MKHSANLFSSDLRPPPERWSLRQLIWCLLCVGLIVALILAYLSHLEKQKQNVLTPLNQDVQLLTEENAQLLQVLDQMQPDPQLIAQRDALLAENQRLSTLLNVLEKRDPRERVQFSGVLNSLGRIEIADLWLDEITLADNQMDFKGYSMSSSAVPQWMQKLASGSDYFTGQSFRELNIEDSEEGDFLRFQFKSSLDEETD